MRHFLLASFVLLLGLCLYMWGRAGSEIPGPGGGISIPQAQAQRGPEANEALDAPTESEPGIRVASGPKEVMPASPAAQEVEPATQRFRLHGTVTLTDAQGANLPLFNGELAFTRNGDDEHVSVVDGAFAVAVDPSDRVRFGSYESGDLQAGDPRAGGRVARLLDWGHRHGPFTGDKRVELAARWLARSQLVVLDARTRQPLSGLTVVERFTSRNCFPHPGKFTEEEVVCRDGDSPLTVTPSADIKRIYFVHRAGYAWGRVALDHEEGGTHEVLLEPGSVDLSIRFTGEPSGPSELLLGPVERDASFGDLELEEPGANALRLTGLPTGKMRVEARASVEQKAVRAEFELNVGENYLDLEIPAMIPQEERPHVTGTLSVPEAWGDSDFSLVFSQIQRPSLGRKFTKGGDGIRVPNSAMVPGQKGGREWRFDAGHLHPGTYRVTVPKVSFRELVEIPHGRSHELALRLPAPHAALLELIDAETGGPITDEEPGLKIEFDRPGLATYDRGLGKWRVRAPLGPLELSVISMRHSYEEMDLVVTNPISETRLELEPDCTLSLVLFDGSTEVPYDVGWARDVKMTSSRADPVVRPSWYSGSSGQYYILPGLGTYYLAFPELEDFEPIPDTAVHIHSGGHHEHRIAVKRK